MYERCEGERDEPWAVEKKREAHITQKSHIKFAGQASGCSWKFDYEL